MALRRGGFTSRGNRHIHLTGTGILFVESHSKPVRGPRLWFNRWQFEPVLILLIPFLFVMSLFLALLFFTLQSWIGDALARLVVIAIVIVLLFGNAFRLLRRPRRERSP